VIKQTVLSKDEWLAAVEDAMKAPDTGGGFTVEELVGVTGLGVSSIKKRLRSMLSDGVVKVVPKWVPGIDGRMYHTHGFVLVRKMAKAKAKTPNKSDMCLKGPLPDGGFGGW
jgi:hypothetical protein